MKTLLPALAMLFLLGCKKDQPTIAEIPEIKVIVPSGDFIKYTIVKGQHYCDRSIYKVFDQPSLSFKVLFDSTAIYTSLDAANQADINKLAGFSEGGDHHVNSARIGWAYTEGALRLYGYVYQDSKRLMKQIRPVEIGREIRCGIKIKKDHYEFTVGDTTIDLERGFTGNPVPGYWLYPYFGGDEVAPHNIYISMMEIKDN